MARCGTIYIEGLRPARLQDTEKIQRGYCPRCLSKINFDARGKPVCSDPTCMWPGFFEQSNAYDPLTGMHYGVEASLIPELLDADLNIAGP